MKHSGKARRAAFKMLLVTLALVILVPLVGVLGWLIASAMVAVSIFLLFLWFIFALFTLYFFRDPNARAFWLALSGRVAWHGRTPSTRSMKRNSAEARLQAHFDVSFGDRCSCAERGGYQWKVSYLKHTEGQFLNATRPNAPLLYENVYIGIQSTDPHEQRIGVKLIAGVSMRRLCRLSPSAITTAAIASARFTLRGCLPAAFRRR